MPRAVQDVDVGKPLLRLSAQGRAPVHDAHALLGVEPVACKQNLCRDVATRTNGGYGESRVSVMVGLLVLGRVVRLCGGAVPAQR